MNDIAGIYGGNGFDSESVETFDGEYTPIPVGWYDLMIEEAEVRETKRKDGSYLHLQLSVVGHEYENRKIFHNITLMNPSAKATEIGQRELASVSKAAGIRVIKDSSELVDKIVAGRAAIKDGDNIIKGFRAAGDHPSQAPCNEAPASRAKQAPQPSSEGQQSAAPPAGAASPAKSKPPWMR